MTYFKTEQAFDPTVMPLVRAWGFGGEGGAFLDSAQVDSLKGLVDFLSIRFQPITIREKFEHSNITEAGEELKVKKTRAEVQLDFSAIAKGYGVDVTSELLEHYGVKEYMVEIGGEVYAKGVSSKGNAWRLGINTPVEDLQKQQQQKAIIKLQNEALATSGNYRNFKVVDGHKIVHTINPKTGYPEISNTLSVSVVAPKCATADAYATAFMVLGYEKGLAIAEDLEDVEALFIYSDEQGNFQTVSTAGLKEDLQVLNAR